MNSPTPLPTRAAKLAAIIEAVGEGTPIKQAVRDNGISLPTFNEWLSQDRDAAISYARAREIRADALVDEALHIADTETDASKARNQIDIRRWIATKHHSRVYGDRVDLNVSQTLDITATLAEARTRIIRPVCDQLPVTDVQTLDLTGLRVPGALDKQSVDRPTGGADDVPDIFS